MQSPAVGPVRRTVNTPNLSVSCLTTASFALIEVTTRTFNKSSHYGGESITMAGL